MANIPIDEAMLENFIADVRRNFKKALESGALTGDESSPMLTREVIKLSAAQMIDTEESKKLRRNLRYYI